MTALDAKAHENRRQALYWRLLARLFDPEEQASLEAASVAIVDDLGLPAALLDPAVSVDSLVQRFPGLAADFDGLLPSPDPATGSAADGPAAPAEEDGQEQVRRAAFVSKLLLNVFAAKPGSVTATQLSEWQRDAGWLRRALGEDGGAGACGMPGTVPGTGPGAEAAGTGAGAGGSGRGLGTGNGLRPVLAEIEGDLVRRMQLREVLSDNRLARQLSPSMSLIEQLLRDKANLSGVALANAKALIRRFVDEVAEVLRTQVRQSSAGTIDRSVPPKRVYRNLDLERTIWKNLTNWSPEDERLYVDRLFYKHTAKRTTPAKMIVVVDQSGSMVDSMVNCTILASIFAGLPKVDVHLVAYDTRALDLTPWVHDPFEVLLRTTLGGGTDGTAAMALARPKVTDPRNTVVVWISDFYDNRALMTDFESLHRSGVKLIPVGSVNSSGQGMVDGWFRDRLKSLGTPVISGHIRKLVVELKTFLA
ncbi:VWA domain-containing protein [Actinomadura verrucosospora]|uniref:VWA containing CoxE family protein n=1 Tax=Actinomadura verrucosospora TaxID=46165 RepID=A0A7D3ZYX0_ACTVE|nr:VWA domain-containing protein [Actinomadura verrucosospora]QKG21664.1 VWA containing CoxE family protein [Actinomadura verrucosospora]